MKHFFYFTFVALLLLGCAKETKVKPQTKLNTTQDGIPTWVYNPMHNGKVGAVGSAKTHFKGRTAQRKLAITRALEELALQKGVKVDTTTKRDEEVRDGFVSSGSNTYSILTSSGKSILAHIEAVWLDRRNDELFIWMVSDE